MHPVLSQSLCIGGFLPISLDGGIRARYSLVCGRISNRYSRIESNGRGIYIWIRYSFVVECDQL